MPWREFLFHYFGPGHVTGLTLGRWWRLLRENRWRVSPTGLMRCSAITCQALANSIWARVERARFEEQAACVEVPPPLFILGHWRSGTTWLHELLAQDERFAWPNNYQALYPQTFLSAESRTAPLMNWFLPKRRPMDNVEWQMDSPQEDEFAICTSCLKSPYLGMVFPRRREHYDRYLTLRDVPAEELAEWREAFLHFLRKLTFKYHKPLALKSPPHTARVRLLLEMFPGAKFVHIHRDPFAVFASSLKMFKIGFDMHGVQRRPSEANVIEWIIRQYRTMYDAFLTERELIPRGDYCELGYEELEQQPLAQLERMYATLGLPEFATVEPRLREYLAANAGYQKNQFREQPAELRSRLAKEWRPCFQEWGYATGEEAAAV